VVDVVIEAQKYTRTSQSNFSVKRKYRRKTSLPQSQNCTTGVSMMSNGESQQNSPKDEQEAAGVSFGKSYPIDFSLHNDDDAPVIYIDDASSGHSLRLEIRNVSQHAIELPAGRDTDTSDKYHFALRFRPGTLSEKQITLVSEEGWSMSRPEPQADGVVSLCFLNPKARTVKPGNVIALTLQGVSAAAGGGARGTRVELKYQGLTFAGDSTSGDSTSIEGCRVQHLSVINHHGKKNIPLHVGFVGSSTILNDGRTQNTLTLRITNVLKPDPSNRDRSTIKFSEKSKFILSFDAQGDGEQEEWALGTKSQEEAIEVTVAGWERRKETEGESPEWILTRSDAAELAAGEAIQIRLSKIMSSCPYGPTNLYLRYENIPGYWDGQFVCPIEKVPILYRERNIGIGTADLKPDRRLEISSPKGDWLFLRQERSQEDGGGFHIHNPWGDEGKEGGEPERNRLEIAYLPPGGKDENNKWAQIVLHGPTGKVGIGTGNPAERLDVAGTVKAASFEDAHGNILPGGVIVMWSGSVDSIPKGWVLCNGENGTPDLRDRFIVGWSDDAKPGTSGGPDRHQHEVGIDASTAEAGEHDHWVPMTSKRKYTGEAWEDFALFNGNGLTTHKGGNHSHQLKFSGKTTECSANRPKWFALCFIMKI
jgi:hypothetical protein